MSSGRDMIAVAGFDSLYDRTQCFDLLNGNVESVRVVCQLLDSRPAKSSHDFLELHPTLCRGSTGFSASLDATFGLTSSCRGQTCRLHLSSHSPEVCQSQHVDTPAAWICWCRSGLRVPDACDRYSTVLCIVVASWGLTQRSFGPVLPL
jgi:hypothetical protein